MKLNKEDSGMHSPTECSCCRCFHCCSKLFSATSSFLFQFNSQLEGSLSQWTSYQEDSRQFITWMERVEESLDPTDKQCPEMRDKTAHLSKVKVSGFFSIALRVVSMRSAAPCVTPLSLSATPRRSAESQHPAGNYHCKKCQYL